MLLYQRAEQDIDFMPSKSSFILFHGLQTDLMVLPVGIRSGNIVIICFASFKLLEILDISQIQIIFYMYIFLGLEKANKYMCT